jgi:predicted ABC-type ATPase
MLERINHLIRSNRSFAFETTLATKSYAAKIREAKEKGYTVTLLFFWLQNYDLAIERVRVRVKEGGHDIPEEVIKRRYLRGVENLFKMYLPIADGALIFDNSEGMPELIAKITFDQKLEILNSSKFNQLKNNHE